MPQLCPQCQKENPSSANFCMYCKTSLVDNVEMAELDRLNNELNEVKGTNRVLRQALNEAQKNNNKQDVMLLQDKLAKEEQSRKEIEASLASKTRENAELKIALGKKKGNSAWVFFLITTLALGGVSFFYYDKDIVSQRQISTLEADKNKLNEKFRGVDTELQNVKNELQKGKISQQKISDVSAYYPIVIKSLKIGNVNKDGTIETNYGQRLYGSNTMYLQPQIEYIGLVSNQNVTLYQKLYRNGTLSTGTSSPMGYSTKTDILVSGSGQCPLSGWGSDTKGHWTSGNYRYEIWYGSTCLKAVDFYIY